MSHCPPHPPLPQVCQCKYGAMLPWQLEASRHSLTSDTAGEPFLQIQFKLVIALLQLLVLAGAKTALETLISYILILISWTLTVHFPRLQFSQRHLVWIPRLETTSFVANPQLHKEAAHKFCGNLAYQEQLVDFSKPEVMAINPGTIGTDSRRSPRVADNLGWDLSRNNLQ